MSVETSAEVCKRNTSLARLPPFRSRNVHQPPDSRCNHVVSTSIAVRSSRTIPSDGGVHQPCVRAGGRACVRACGRARVVEMCGVCVSRYGFGVCIVASWLRVCGESLRVASRAMGNRRYKPGFAADNASQPNPSPSSLPGKKFSISTSASAARACTTARPSWCFRSTAQLRLPRLTDKK